MCSYDSKWKLNLGWFKICRSDVRVFAVVGWIRLCLHFDQLFAQDRRKEFIFFMFLRFPLDAGDGGAVTINVGKFVWNRINLDLMGRQMNRQGDGPCHLVGLLVVKFISLHQWKSWPYAFICGVYLAIWIWNYLCNKGAGKLVFYMLSLIVTELKFWVETLNGPGLLEVHIFAWWLAVFSYPFFNTFSDMQLMYICYPKLYRCSLLTGDKTILNIQKTWDWAKKYKPIQYGGKVLVCIDNLACGKTVVANALCHPILSKRI